MACTTQPAAQSLHDRHTQSAARIAQLAPHRVHRIDCITLLISRNVHHIARTTLLCTALVAP
eukprot:5772524-Pyramimonas_sp.AAC.1